MERSVSGLLGPVLLTFVGIAGLLILDVSKALAQSNSVANGAAARPSFEVASIKLNPDCSGDHQDEQFSPGRVSVTCIKLSNLMIAGYGTFASGPIPNPQRLRVFGLPEWADSARYNVTAKAKGDAPMDQMFGPMLQVLLEDRFRLTVHREARELPVYNLTLAKGGLKLQRSKDGSCVPVDLSHADQPSPNWCGRMTGQGSGLHVIDDAYGMSMAEIASKFLANRLDRPVIDKTGVTGLFDAHLEFARSSTAAPDSPEPDPGAPSIFTAVQEQLGLKLSPDKGPVEVLVVDHVERPSAD